MRSTLCIFVLQTRLGPPAKRRRRLGDGRGLRVSKTPFMGFDEITNILYLLLQGVGVGIAASITVGPVAVLCIQRTLSKSRRSGFASGLGVACADTLMAIFAMLFSSILQRSIEANRLILSVVSGIIVVIVGVYIFLQTP